MGAIPNQYTLLFKGGHAVTYQLGGLWRGALYTRSYRLEQMLHLGAKAGYVSIGVGWFGHGDHTIIFKLNLGNSAPTNKGAYAMLAISTFCSRK